jgi:cephalosporin hydroxylase
VTDWQKMFGTRTDKFVNGYWPLYEQITATLPAAPAILELGVAYGGSLELWKAMFPDGTIAGLDNCADFDSSPWYPEGTREIRRGQDDSMGAIEAFRISPAGYDMIVDDASHVACLSRASLELYWPLVKPGGWYVFEDWAVGSEDSPYYRSHYGWDGQLRLAQEFTAKIARQDHSDIEEIRSRHSILAARKWIDDGRRRGAFTGASWDSTGHLVLPLGTSL